MASTITAEDTMPHITRITRELLHEWGACYTDERIAALVPPDGVAPLEVLDANIPEADRLWVLLREEIIPAATLRLLAVRWARGVLEAERAAGREPAAESWAALDVAERYARGESTDAELTIAEDAAWSAWNSTAAGHTAAAAAGHTAAAAAVVASWRAADAAADAAIEVAARDARDAARAAVSEAQLADVRRVLLGGEP